MELAYKPKNFKKYKSMYIFLLPAIIITFVFCYLPMLGVIIAFQDFVVTKGFFGSSFVGLKHFREFLQNPDFFEALKNTLGINILLIVIGFPLPIIFALIINEIKLNTFKRVSQTISYLPHFVSWVIVGGMLARLLDYETGSVNLFIQAFGGEKIPFLRDPKYFWTILLTASIWKDLGWNSIIYLAALSGIDAEQYESATVDGAGRFKRLIYITIPGIMPVAGLLLVLTIGSLFQTAGGASFDAVYNLKNPMVAGAANTLDIYVYVQGIKKNFLSYAAAIGVAQSIVSLLLVLGSNAISKRLSGYGVF